MLWNQELVLGIRDSTDFLGLWKLTLVNRLNTLLEQVRPDGSGREAISQMCQQWIEHTKAHFARENMMMEQYAFPAYPCHQGEHEQALYKLESQYQQW